MAESEEASSQEGFEARRAPASQAQFLSTLLTLLVIIILFIGMPMAYLRILPRFLDLWTLGILVIGLLVLKRFLKEETPPAAGGEESWEDYAVGMVHEVKNQLMDFQPDQHGGPEGLADYLENTQKVLEETVATLRDRARREAEERGEPPDGP